jgi:hypothetical protein
VHHVAIDLERARKLGRRLRVEVAIDRTHWLRREVELVFTRNPDGTLRPVRVRVGEQASDEEVVADGGVASTCERYNSALDRLRRLGNRLTEAVCQGRIALVAGSPIAEAHRDLAPLDKLIAWRQAQTMGSGVVRAATLAREVEFFARFDAELEPVILAAEHASRAPEMLASSRRAAGQRWPR